MTELADPSVPAPTVLVVDDTPANLDAIVALLETQGYDVLVASSGEQALRTAASAGPQLILLDVMMPGLDGYETCRRLKASPATADVPVIFISANDDVGGIVRGFEVGGVDYVSKPFQAAEVVARVGTHLRVAQLAKQLAARNAELSAAIDRLTREAERRTRAEDALDTAAGRVAVLSGREAERWDAEGFVGRSATLRRILDDVGRVRNFGSVGVLITGESGTGKELVARAIHSGSPRAGGPFIPVNCVAVPADLAESMFFGHVRGAFTGATGDRKGYFELADGGTLFLDEIGDMPAVLQAKLLRVLEDGRVTPVGSPRERKVDVRVVAATNADLDRQIATGVFRQDLYFRLAQFCVELPPLRERREDVPHLAAHFVRLFAREMGLEPPDIDPAVFDALGRYDFPGNVRELKNVIERCLIDSGGGPVSPRHLRLSPRAGSVAMIAPPPPPAPATNGTDPTAGLPLNLEEAESLLIKRALAETNGNVAEAARRLGVNRTRIYRKMGER